MGSPKGPLIKSMSQYSLKFGHLVIFLQTNFGNLLKFANLDSTHKEISNVIWVHMLWMWDKAAAQKIPFTHYCYDMGKRNLLCRTLILDPNHINPYIS